LKKRDQGVTTMSENEIYEEKPLFVLLEMEMAIRRKKRYLRQKCKRGARQ
jgi:hypothetical protein